MKLVHCITSSQHSLLEEWGRLMSLRKLKKINVSSGILKPKDDQASSTVLYNTSRKQPVDLSGSPKESSRHVAFTSCHKWWGGLFIYTTVFDSSCSCNKPLTHIPASNHKKIINSPAQTLVESWLWSVIATYEKWTDIYSYVQRKN